MSLLCLDPEKLFYEGILMLPREVWDPELGQTQVKINTDVGEFDSFILGMAHHLREIDASYLDFMVSQDMERFFRLTTAPIINTKGVELARGDFPDPSVSEAIAANKNIRYLAISFSDGQSVVEIDQSRSIEILDMSYSDEDIAIFPESRGRLIRLLKMPQLRELNFSGNLLEDFSVDEVLVVSPSLKVLILKNCGLFQDDMMVLLRSPYLQYLDLSGDQEDPVPDVPESNVVLSHLILPEETKKSWVVERNSRTRSLFESCSEGPEILRIFQETE